MKILIADDHAMMRWAVREALAHAFPEAEFGEAATVPDTLAQVRERDWDVAVLDIAMPGGTGFDVLKELQRTERRVRVLVYSMHPENQYAARAMEAGAAGYLSKDAGPDKLVEAVRALVTEQA